MRTPSPRARIALGFGVIPVSVLAAAAVVVTSSWSVFSATTASPSNSWTTGNVVLTNDSNGSSQTQAGGAMFSATGIQPNTAVSYKCVTVQSTGSLGSTVKLYGTVVGTTDNNLDQYLNLTVEVGTATSTTGGACTGFSAASTIYATNTLSNFTSTYSSYATGLATSWTPTGSSTETKVFRFAVQPRNTMTNTQQSSTTRATFTWEAQTS